MLESKFFREGYKELIKYSDEYDNIRKILIHHIEAVVKKRSRLFLDVGAGDVKALTDHISPFFEETDIIETDKTWWESYRKKGYILIGQKVEETKIEPSHFDSILCSHVLYYVPKEKWQRVIESLYTGLSSDGILMFILHSENSDTFQIMNRMMDGNLDVSAEGLERICSSFDPESINYEGDISIPDERVYGMLMQFLRYSCPRPISDDKFREVLEKNRHISTMTNNGTIIVIRK